MQTGTRLLHRLAIGTCCGRQPQRLMSQDTPHRRRARIGMITPSSNSVLEPTTIAVTGSLYPRVSTHYTRIEVKTISLEPESLAHFGTDRFVQAARLLADAGMDVIAWNGTAGAWQGVAA